MAIPLMVGIDGSEASLKAVDWAAHEAVIHDLPLHLVHAAASDGEASELVAAASQRARSSAPHVRLSSEVPHEEAASALVGRGRNAFALVLGSRGRGGLAGLLLGSVSLAVAARADCPVAVVRGRAQYEADRYGSVVVGVDGGGSGTAVRFALREAHVRRCRLVAVHAWAVPLGTPAGSLPLPGYASEARRRMPGEVLDDALDGPAEQYPGASVSRLAVEGHARKALLDASADADLLVVGARRRHGQPGLQLGLTNHAVLHHAPCPVAVVPHI